MKIKKWLKFFGLSFFSDNIAGQAPNFGFTSVILVLILSFFFFLFGYYGADVLPFATHYNNAGQYKEFLNDAFEKIEIEIAGGKAHSEKLINSYTTDAAYAKNGYNLIVDTRPSDTLIEFTQVAKKDGIEISYEEYRALGETQREDYTLKTVYTDKALDITEESAKTYTDFLSADESAKSVYEALNKDADDYNEQLYYLYVKYYYASVGSVLYGAQAPVLRDYYYYNYISNGNAYYFYVFDNMIAGSFETDGGIPMVFGGYFNKCSDGPVTDIDGFINDVYYETAGYLAINYVIGAISQFFLLIFLPIIVGLIMWGVSKLVKDGWEKTFVGCYKIVNAFVWGSALITALITLLSGWLTAAGTMYSIMAVIFGVILLARTAIFCITSMVKNRKELVQSEQMKDNDILGGD